MILGSFSIFFTLFTVFPGVITGHMALSRIKKSPNENDGKGMAIVGLVFSYFFLITVYRTDRYYCFTFPIVLSFKDALFEGFNEGLQQDMKLGLSGQ